MKPMHWLKTVFILLLLGLVSCQSQQSSTGLAQLNLPTEDNGSGIGGTGLIDNGDSGIGGTGVIGVITGFGSIWVNGVRIAVDEQTRLLTPWGEMPAQDLAVGHQVLVQTEADSNRPLNNQLQLLMPLNGEISAINNEQGYFSLLGQTVHFSPETQLATELKLGQKVTVSGFYQADSNWLATRVEPARSETAYLQPSVVAVEWAPTTHRLLLQGYVQPTDNDQPAWHQAWLSHGQSMVLADKVQLNSNQLQIMRVERDHQRWRVEQNQPMTKWLEVWPEPMRRSMKGRDVMQSPLWQQQQQHRQFRQEMKQPHRSPSGGMRPMNGR